MTEVFSLDDLPFHRASQLPWYITKLQQILREQIWQIIPWASPGDTLIWWAKFSTNPQGDILKLEVLLHSISTQKNTNIQRDLSDTIFQEETQEELSKLEIFILMAIYFHLTALQVVLEQSIQDAWVWHQKCISLLANTLQKVRQVLVKKQADISSITIENI